MKWTVSWEQTDQNTDKNNNSIHKIYWKKLIIWSSYIYESCMKELIYFTTDTRLPASHPTPPPPLHFIY